MEPLNPTTGLLAKLGSIVVHTEEYLSDAGRPIDRVSLQQVLDDPEVQEWLAAMRDAALVPVKR